MLFKVFKNIQYINTVLRIFKYSALTSLAVNRTVTIQPPNSHVKIYSLHVVKPNALRGVVSKEVNLMCKR